MPLADKDASADTPWLRSLRGLTDDRMRAELLGYERSLAELTEMRAAAAGAVDALHNATSRAEADLAEADKEPDVSVRRLGDLRHPEQFAVGRRRAENAVQRTAMAKRYVESQRRLGEAVQTTATLDNEMRRVREVAQLRVERLHAHGCRRISAYWQHVVRKHPEGARLNDLSTPQDPGLPTWPWDVEGGQQP